MRGHRSARLRAIHLVLALHPVGSDLECPGQDQHRNKSDGQHDDRDAYRRVTETECGKDRFHQLDHQPGRHRIGGAYAKDIATLEFFEDRRHPWLTLLTHS